MLHVLISKTDIVAVVWCGCEIWCLTSREEQRLRICESVLVSGIFVGEGVGIEGCRRLCCELYVCYCSPDIINIIIVRKMINMCNVVCI
jgi:hypothetical protein